MQAFRKKIKLLRDRQKLHRVMAIQNNGTLSISSETARSSQLYRCKALNFPFSCFQTVIALRLNQALQTGSPITWSAILKFMPHPSTDILRETKIS